MTIATGQTALASDFPRGGCRLYQNASTSLNSGGYETINFQLEQFDTSGFHEAVTHPSRITIPATGYYHVGGSVIPTSSGDLCCRIFKNNSETIAINGAENISNPPRGCSVSTIYYFTAGDYIELQAEGSTSFGTSGDVETSFWAYRINLTPTG